MRFRQLPQVMKKQDPVFAINNFRGLNNRSVSTEIGDNEAQSLNNIDLTDTGGIKKRNGTNIVADDKGALAVKGLHSAYYGDGTAHMLMASQSATTSGLWYRAGAGATWAEVVLNGATMLANKDAEFEDFFDGTNEMTFIADGTTFQKYQASTHKIIDATTIPGTTTDNVTMLKLYKNRLYATGGTSVPERVFYSALGDGDSWGANDWFQVPSESTNEAARAGDPITALAVYQDRLIIFKNRSIWAYDTHQLRQITDKHGCVGKRAVCTSDNALYFADNDGVYRLSGNYVEKVSKKIQGTWDAIPAGLVPSIAMTYSEGKVYVATGAAAASTNNIILINYTNLPVDDEGQQPWTYWSGDATDSLSASCFTIYEATTTTKPILCYGSAITQSTVIELGTGTADYKHAATAGQSVAIASHYMTKDYPLVARYKKLFAIYKSQSATSGLGILISIDFGQDSKTFSFDMKEPGDVYGTGVYGTVIYGGQSAIIAKGNVSKKGKFINYKFQNNAADQPWTLWELKQIFKLIQLR